MAFKLCSESKRTLKNCTVVSRLYKDNNNQEIEYSEIFEGSPNDEKISRVFLYDENLSNLKDFHTSPTLENKFIQRNSNEKMICPCSLEGELVCKTCSHSKTYKQGIKISAGEINIENVDEFISGKKCCHEWKIVSKDEELLITPYPNHPEAWISISRCIILSCTKCGKLEQVTSRT